MLALITGASSGIGRDMARELAKRNIDLIVVARREERLLKLKEELKNVKVEIIVLDLSKEENCYNLYQQVKDKDIDILINNAGFGVFGNFYETSLDKELNLIKVNDVAPHILTKLFLQDFIKKDKGKILNVCSSAAFYYGPLMATYYASKAYLYSLSLAIHEELRKKKSKVTISMLCPGPIATEFQEVADVKFAGKPYKSEYVATKAITGLLKGKTIIVPGAKMKVAKFFSRFLTDKMIAKIAYTQQKRKKD